MKLVAVLATMLAFASACSDSPTDPRLQANNEVAFVSTALRVHMLRLRIVDADANATPRALADTSNIIYDFSWSPDGQRIAYEGLDGQFRHYFAILSVSSGAETRLAVTDGGRIHLSGEFWSPDGRFIVRQEFGGLLEIMAPDGSGRRALVTRALDFAWARQGQELIVVKYSPTPLAPSTGFLRINPATGDSVRVLFPRGGLNTTEELTVAPDGERFAYVNALERSIVISTLDGREIRTFRDEQGEQYSRPRWSPNGRWILVERIARTPDFYFDVSLVRLDVDAGTALTVVSGLRSSATAQWSADSKRIAYSRTGPPIDPQLSDVPADIHIVNADGTNDRVIAMPPSFSYKPKWRPGNN